MQFASEGFLETVGIDLVSGRALTRADMESSAPVALVNAHLVEQYFGTRSPVGQTLRVDQLDGTMIGGQDPVFQIVGVVADTANQGFDGDLDPEVYLPYTSSSFGGRSFVLRSDLSPGATVAAIHAVVREVDPRVAVTAAESLLESYVGFLGPYTHEQRFTVIVLVSFAVVGLGLLAVGVYGVVNYSVTRLEREFAIRLALGAGRAHVAGRVLWVTLRLVGIGSAVGLAAGLGLGRLLASQLYETSPRDPVVLGTALVVTMSAGVLACVAPAIRVTRVQPATALRHE
jgi:putative ABC transport system permease protein